MKVYMKGFTKKAAFTLSLIILKDEPSLTV